MYFLDNFSEQEIFVSISLRLECYGRLPKCSVSKESTCDAGDVGLIPKLGRSPEGGHGNPLQCSCLGNPINRGAWQATVHKITKSWT